MHSTIFSKYLVLPITTFPTLKYIHGSGRVRTDIFFHDKKAVYQLTTNPNILLRPVEFESTQSVWKTNVLPLNYGRLDVNYMFKHKTICISRRVEIVLTYLVFCFMLLLRRRSQKQDYSCMLF